jgi:arylsulfatase A-like enzyme
MNPARLRCARLGALSLGVSLAALGAPVFTTAAAVATTPPNIVLIVADDLGYDQTSLYGRTGSIPTPNLAALGDDGVRVTDGYVASPVCSPSRSAIMTAREPARVGADSNFLTRGRPERMPTDTFVKNLPSAYTTAAIGKWDLAGAAAPFDSDHLPAAMGFDNFYGLLNGEHDYCPPAPGQTNLKEYNPATGNYDNRASTDYLTTEFTNHAVDYIDTHAANSATQPFFLYLAYTAPHVPLETPTTCAGGSQSDQDRFHDMVTIMDNGIGEVRQSLADKGIANNTLVIFLSDNGQQTDFYTGPTRGGKYTLFEGGVRVPFALTWPAVLPAATS